MYIKVIFYQNSTKYFILNCFLPLISNFPPNWVALKQEIDCGCGCIPLVSNKAI